MERNLQFRIAKTEQELWEVFHLRYLGYLDSSYLDPTYFPDKIEKDKWDDIAINFLAQDLDTKKYLGCVRLIPDSKRGLPIEERINIDDFRSPEKKIWEHSRWVSWPKGQPDVNWGLFKATVQYSWMQGVTHWIGLGICEMKRFYESRGFYQLEPYREIEFLAEEGYKPNKRFFCTIFDFNLIYNSNPEDLPFKPHPNVFKALKPDYKIKLD